MSETTTTRAGAQALVDAGADHATESYTLSVNGADRPVADAWIGESLLYVLRERLGLYGSKGACEQGECGSCSVLVDGELAREATDPISDQRGTAAFRRHAVGVVATRALQRSLAA